MIMDLHFANLATNNAQRAKINQASALHAISVKLLGLMKAQILINVPAISDFMMIKITFAKVNYFVNNRMLILMYKL